MGATEVAVILKNGDVSDAFHTAMRLMVVFCEMLRSVALKISPLTHKQMVFPKALPGKSQITILSFTFDGCSTRTGTVVLILPSMMFKAVIKIMFARIFCCCHAFLNWTKTELKAVNDTLLSVDPQLLYKGRVLDVHQRVFSSKTISF